ncbi:MAG: phosphatase PAP2 family protein [Anaerolineae bacterium]|nr:phosphatase PAP2 family protein [Anaerolineae bacterium]
MNFARLLELDHRYSTRLQVAEKPGAARTLAGLLGHTGDSWFWLGAMVILYIIGPWEWKMRALVLFGGILVLAAVVMLLKFTIRRQRPEGEWGQIYRKTDPHSFPSGHAARGMLIGVIALGLGPVWFGILLIIWGPLVGLARVATGLHYLSDVAAGWILGLIFGILAVQTAGNFLPI